MSIRIVSPVQGEVVDLTPLGIEIECLGALRAGRRHSFLLKRGFSSERLRTRVKWCFLERSEPGASPSSPARYHCCLEAEGLDPRVLRFLATGLEH